MSQKTLWVVGGGIETVPAIMRAQEMGLYVVVSDANTEAPGCKAADFAVQASTYDESATALAALAFRSERHEIDGVIALAADVPGTVAHVAIQLGLSHLPWNIATLGSNKWDMKRHLVAKGIPTAAGRLISTASEARDFMQGHWPYGCVIKPLGSRGARNVQRVCAESDLVMAVRRAIGKHYAALIEEWLPGPQFSTETVLLADGAADTYVLDRCYDDLDRVYPYVVETGAQGPSIASDHALRFIEALATRAARSVVVGYPCTVKGDLVLTPDGTKVIELALRLSGGYMSSRLIPLMTGVDLVGIAIRLALGERVSSEELRPKHRAGVAIRYEVPNGCTCHPERGRHVIEIRTTATEAVQGAESRLAASLSASKAAETGPPAALAPSGGQNASHASSQPASQPGGLKTAPTLREQSMTMSFGNPEKPAPAPFERVRAFLDQAVQQLTAEMVSQQARYLVPDGDILALVKAVAAVEGRTPWQVLRSWALRHAIPVNGLFDRSCRLTSAELEIVAARLRDLLGYVVLGLVVCEEEEE